MDKIIVVGNIHDSNNIFCANGRVYDCGGIAPTLGASHFAIEKYILVGAEDERKQKTEVSRRYR